MSLPKSVERVLLAVDNLEEVAFGTPFPKLTSEPAADADVEQVIRAAAQWGEAIGQAFGRIGEVEELGTPGGSLLSNFEEPGQGREFDHAVTIIGEVPTEYRESQALFFHFEFAKHPGRRSYDGPKSLSDPSMRGIAFTTENWPEIRERLKRGYQLITSRVVGLTRWIRDRIQGLEEALMPQITMIGRGKYNRVEVEVRFAGGSRTTTLSGIQAVFLRDLGEKGTATAARKTKADVVKAIPELHLWIEAMQRSPRATEQEATYGIPPDVQGNIELSEL